MKLILERGGEGIRTPNKKADEKDVSCISDILFIKSGIRS